MTQRTEHQPTQLEKAIDSVIDAVKLAAPIAYAQNKPPMPEKNFRELLARVLENMTLNDWRRRLDLDPLPIDPERR